MPEDPLNYEDFSFFLLRSYLKGEGLLLINRDIALKLADGVLGSCYKPEKYRRNMPLTIAEAENSDDWVVTGSAPHITVDLFNAEPDIAGRYEIHINKYNARITKLVFT